MTDMILILHRLAVGLKKLGAMEASEVERLSGGLLPEDKKSIERNYQDPKAFEKVLSSNQVYPVSAGGKKSLLGSGSYGRAFRVVYDGKPAAAKVSLDPESRDVGVWQKIMAVREKLPEDLKKHIPEIYLAKQGIIDDPQNKIYDALPYQLVVMEALRPIGDNMFTILTGGGEKTEIDPKELHSWLVDLISKLQETLKNLTPSYATSTKDIKLEMMFSAIGSLLGDADISDLWKILYLQPKVLHYENRKDLAKIIYSWVRRKVNSNFDLEPEEIESGWRKVENSIIYTISLRPNTYPEVPVFHWEKGQKTLDSYPPETAKLVEMLMELEKYGIKWNDVHHENIMLGMDGNLKIIDVGLYDLV